jgi:hypothetical protein
MEYRIRETGAVMYEAELRSYLLANGGPSFAELTPEVMEAVGVDPVFEGPQATGGTVYQFSMRDGAEQGDAGKWYSKYVLGPVFANADDEAAYHARRDSEQATAVRAERNTRLAASDWTQVADAPVDKSAWATYRQALRDISTQPGFPWTTQWPSKPQ